MLVYNTQLHKKVELTPIEPGKIRMYVCGPTVYDQIHVGNGAHVPGLRRHSPLPYVQAATRSPSPRT